MAFLHLSLKVPSPPGPQAVPPPSGANSPMRHPHAHSGMLSPARGCSAWSRVAETKHRCQAPQRIRRPTSLRDQFLALGAKGLEGEG